MKKIKTEFLIIGSGPGGAAASERLLNSKKEVLMIEEGSDFSCAFSFTSSAFFTSSVS